MSAEHIVILCGVGVVALLWLAIRFSRQIVRVLLIAGGIILVGIVAVSGLSSSLASLQTARTAQTAIRATSITSGLAGIAIGGLAVISLGAACIAGFFWLKWKLAERQRQPAQPKPRKQLPNQEPEIVYARPCGRVVEDDADLSEVDLS